MPVPLVAATPLILGGLNAIGGALSGAAAGKANKAQTEEQKRQYNLSQSNTVRRQLEMASLRDRLLYNLNARMGLPQQSMGINFDSSGKYQGLTGTQDQQNNGLNKQLTAYHPGMGGVDPDFYRGQLNSMRGAYFPAVWSDPSGVGNYQGGWNTGWRPEWRKGSTGPYAPPEGGPTYNPTPNPNFAASASSPTSGNSLRGPLSVLGRGRR